MVASCADNTGSLEADENVSCFSLSNYEEVKILTIEPRSKPNNDSGTVIEVKRAELGVVFAGLIGALCMLIVFVTAYLIKRQMKRSRYTVAKRTKSVRKKEKFTNKTPEASRVESNVRVQSCQLVVDLTKRENGSKIETTRYHDEWSSSFVNEKSLLQPNKVSDDVNSVKALIERKPLLPFSIENLPSIDDDKTSVTERKPEQTNTKNAERNVAVDVLNLGDVAPNLPPKQRSSKNSGSTEIKDAIPAEPKGNDHHKKVYSTSALDALVLPLPPTDTAGSENTGSYTSTPRTPPPTFKPPPPPFSNVSIQKHNTFSSLHGTKAKPPVPPKSAAVVRSISLKASSPPRRPNLISSKDDQDLLRLGKVTETEAKQDIGKALDFHRDFTKSSFGPKRD